MSIKVKESHVARRDVSAQERESTEEKARERAKGDVPDHVFCAKDHTGFVTVLHINGGKGKRTVPSGKGYKNSSPFRQAYLEGDRRDWITGAGAFAVWFPSLKNFASFDLQ